jgi:hypothetical protein
MGRGGAGGPWSNSKGVIDQKLNKLAVNFNLRTKKKNAELMRIVSKQLMRMTPYCSIVCLLPKLFFLRG